MKRKPAAQRPLFGGINTITCMLCHHPGATVPYDMLLDEWYEFNGEQRQVKAFGWRHEDGECITDDPALE